LKHNLLDPGNYNTKRSLYALLLSFLGFIQLSIVPAQATPPSGCVPEGYSGYIFSGLFDQYIPEPAADGAGFRAYRFPDAPNSLGYWQDGCAKRMLPSDRALGLYNPEVFFFGTHGRLKSNQVQPLQLLTPGSCKYGFAATCNELARGPTHTATEMARQTGKICFGINPDIDASMIVNMRGNKTEITVQEILPDGSDGAILGRGSKQCATIVAVRPDGRVIQVPHPERLPQLPGVEFNLGGSTATECNSGMAVSRRSSGLPSCAPPQAAGRPSIASLVGSRVQASLHSLSGTLNRASACNVRYGGAPEMVLSFAPNLLNGLSAPYFPNNSQAPTASKCGGNPFESDAPGMLAYLTGDGRTFSDVCGNLVYITTGRITHNPGTKQWWDLTSRDFDILPGTWW
jgi:hypothetical protein